MGRGLALVLLIGLGILTPLEALAEEDQAAQVPPDLTGGAGGLKAGG